MLCLLGLYDVWQRSTLASGMLTVQQSFIAQSSFFQPILLPLPVKGSRRAVAAMGNQRLLSAPSAMHRFQTPSNGAMWVPCGEIAFESVWL